VIVAKESAISAGKLVDTLIRVSDQRNLHASRHQQLKDGLMQRANIL
jgi:hypothetical protein